MTSEKVIERLMAYKWFVKTRNLHELALVLNTCIDAGIDWADETEAKDFAPQYNERNESEKIIFVGCNNFYPKLSWDDREMACENITDWFFKEIKGDDVEKNVHVVAGKYFDNYEIDDKYNEERNIKYCNAFSTIDLAIQDIIDKNLTDYSFCEIEFDNKVITISDIEIKPKHTPLPIPVELWRLIDKNFVCAAMDSFGDTIFYTTDKIEVKDKGWNFIEHINANNHQQELAVNLFNINTDGIDWKASLTKRPEVV